ncbi:MAG: type II toxin-antitoxin system PemK/MazF family toxin [Actinobacteria bacterium]|nr:type II toxin-antitoxin system PemK/MazF family toxin [Actinomycetota bacterium]
MQPGQIYNIKGPPRPGSDSDELFKPRPALILFPGEVDPGGDHVIVVTRISASSKRFVALRTTDRELDWKECGLDEPSVLRCRQIQSVPLPWIGHYIGDITPFDLLYEARRIAQKLLAG